MTEINTLWVLLAASLVFFMQPGFAMCEAGFTRAKNAGNIIMKNLMDLAIGSVLFWLVGFGIMFGTQSAIFGGIDFLVAGDYTAILPDGVGLYSYLIFQTVFCATSATIVSGAMAERTKFSAYCIYSAVISVLIYPISGHWIWGGGWLAELGFHDFAGSTTVHMVGGVCAIIGAKILGARLGKYDKDGNSKAIPGHNIPIAALGVFILWFGWFGFNGGSTLAIVGDAADAAGSIIFNTNLAAAFSTVVVMLFTWIRYGKPDVSMTLNGSLAGLVAITAGCDAVNAIGASAIGIIAGFVVVLSIEFIDQKLHIDDPVGASSVHGVCGALGTILTAVFATSSFLADSEMTRIAFIKAQCIGVVSVAIWCAITITITFIIIKKTMGLRVDAAVEMSGLDLTEHGLLSSYPDFMNSLGAVNSVLDCEANPDLPICIEQAKILENTLTDTVPVEYKSAPAAITTSDGSSITKIEILTKQERFEVLKTALLNIGITGMTVTNVMGCGIQKGHTEYYRGSVQEANLVPRLQVEIVVSKVPVQTVIETAKKVLYTGHIGDGKIFVYNVANVVKVRTGEEGYAALQDVEQY